MVGELKSIRVRSVAGGGKRPEESSIREEKGRSRRRWRAKREKRRICWNGRQKMRRDIPWPERISGLQAKFQQRFICTFAAATTVDLLLSTIAAAATRLFR
ncbi:hypothetical protein Dimus_001803 [Dionaea muscipula]